MKNLIWIAAVVVLAVAVYMINSPTTKGRLTVMTWNQEETLVCHKGHTMVLQDRIVENPTAEVIMVSDGCDITIKNCTFKGPNPINVAGVARFTMIGGKLEAEKIGMIVGAGDVVLRDVEVVAKQAGLVAVGESRVTVEGGSITSKTTGVDARETAVVRIDGTTVTGDSYSIKAVAQAKVAVTPKSQLQGAVEKQGFGMVAMDGNLEAEKQRLAATEARESQQQLVFDKYAKGACKGFHQCFLRAGLEGGMVDGEIHMPVDKRGRVRGAKVLFAVPAANRCLQKVARGKKVPRFRGPPGNLICRFNGVVQKAQGSVAYDSSYEVAAPTEDTTNNQP
jgi:hypothetical protein